MKRTLKLEHIYDYQKIQTQYSFSPRLLDFKTYRLHQTNVDKRKHFKTARRKIYIFGLPCRPRPHPSSSAADQHSGAKRGARFNFSMWHKVTLVEVKDEKTTGIGDQPMTESTMKVTLVIDSSPQHSATVDGEGMYSCSR